MSLHVPNKSLHHNTVIHATKATVETAIQNMVDIVDKQQALQAIDNIVDQLNNFKRHYAGVRDEEQIPPSNAIRRDERKQRN